MMADAVKNFAKSNVSTTYDASATSIVLATGGGAKFPAAPFNVVWWNVTDYADPADDPNVEIVRVTAISTDTLTVMRAQEGTSASTKNTAGKTYRMIQAVTKALVDSLASPWTDGTGITYLTDTAEDFAVGGSTVTGSPFAVDVSAGAIYGGLTTSAGMTFYSRMTASYPYTGAFTFDCTGATGDYTGVVVKKGGTRLWDIGSWTPNWSASMIGLYGGGDGSSALVSCKSAGVGVGTTGAGGWALGFVRWSTYWKPVLWAEESSATMGCKFDLGVEAEKMLVLDCVIPTNVEGTGSGYNTAGVTGSVASTLVQTTNNTATTLIARTLNDNTVYRIEAEVAARRTDSAGRGCYARSVLVYRAGGSATIEGSVATIGTDVENGITCTVTLDVSGNDVRLRVTGETGKTIKWKGTLRIVAAG